MKELLSVTSEKKLLSVGYIVAFQLCSCLPEVVGSTHFATNH